MTRRYKHLTVEQMRQGFKKPDAAAPIRVAPGVPAAATRRLTAPVDDASSPRLAAELLSPEPIVAQPDATRSIVATDAGLTPNPGANTKPRTQSNLL
jgi:hypothetical protein